MQFGYDVAGFELGLATQCENPRETSPSHQLMDRISRILPRHAVAVGIALGMLMIARGSVGATTDPVALARTALSAASAARVSAETRLSELSVQQQRGAQDLASRSLDAKDVLTELTAARAAARTQLLDAYIEGGNLERLSTMLGSAGPTAASLRTSLLLSGAQDAANAAEAYETLKRHNDPALVALAESADTLQRQVDTATSDVAQASAYEADAERQLADALDQQSADNAAAAAAASRTTTTTTTTKPPSLRASVRPAVAGSVVAISIADPGPLGSDAGWAKLRECESHGNYRAVSASGRYRGAYQFAMSTWSSTGGVGDPIDAAPAEQDLRARILYQRSGARSWPNCGVHLR